PRGTPGSAPDTTGPGRLAHPDLGGTSSASVPWANPRERYVCLCPVGPGPPGGPGASRPSGAAAISVRLQHRLTWSPPWGVVAVPRDSLGRVSARSPCEIRTLSREAIV